MANEINIALDPIEQTGLTVSANIKSAGGTLINNIALIENGVSAFYSGALDLSLIADGAYSVQSIDDTSGLMIGSGMLFVLDGLEVDSETIQANDNANKDLIITDIGLAQTTIDDIQKYHMNRRVWNKGNATITIYEDDGTTPRKVFDNILDVDEATVEINPQ